MKKQDFVQLFSAFQEEALGIVKFKNQCYAKDDDAFANLRGAEVIGLAVEDALTFRMIEKLIRISNLIKTKGNTHEDLIDLANYAGILDIFLNSKSNG